MNWMQIVGALLMLGCFLTVFENFWIALLLLAVGAVVFQCGINKAAAKKREAAEERWRQIIHRNPSNSTDTANTETKAE